MDTNVSLDPSSTCNSDSINNVVVLEKEIKKKQSKGQWCFAINCTYNCAANRDVSFFSISKRQRQMSPVGNQFKKTRLVK